MASLLLTTGYLASFLSFAIGNRMLGELSLLVFSITSLLVILREWRTAPLLVLSGMIWGLLGEYIGLNYGFPFGSYRYLAFKGAEVLGVPYPIIIAWGIYLYTSYLASASFLREKLKRAFFASFLMVNLDLAIDPVMVARGLWAWNQRGEWFGIPLSNYAGWFAVSLLASLTYARLSKDEPETTGPITFLPYLSIYAQLFYLSPLEILPAVLISFLIAIAIFTLTLRTFLKNLQKFSQEISS